MCGYIYPKKKNQGISFVPFFHMQFVFLRVSFSLHVSPYIHCYCLLTHCTRRYTTTVHVGLVLSIFRQILGRSLYYYERQMKFTAFGLDLKIDCYPQLHTVTIGLMDHLYLFIFGIHEYYVQETKVMYYPD